MSDSAPLYALIIIIAFVAVVAGLFWLIFSEACGQDSCNRGGRCGALGWK
jgi:hypothetical protein